MSSIYKKGRDGYYYYQTYVFNPASNKKDRKVFHALGTKDFEEAKIKQNDLDSKYYSQKTRKHGFKQNLFYILILILFVSISFVLTFSNEEDANLTLKESSLTMIPEATPEEHYGDVIKKSNINDHEIKELNKVNIVDSKNISNDAHKGKIINQHNIIRIEKLSENFKQGKLSVLIDEKSSDESQRMLCRSLLKSHKEFSSIIICLYADTELGKNLAIGKIDDMGIKNKTDSWLAMYTYNSVEGEYFDPNPNSYLGAK